MQQRKKAKKQDLAEESGRKGVRVAKDGGLRVFFVATCANYYIILLCREGGKYQRVKCRVGIKKTMGANNPIPEKTILEMSGVPKEYKNSYMNSLKGYMCDKCGKKDLGDHTETSDVAGAYS